MIWWDSFFDDSARSASVDTEREARTTCGCYEKAHLRSHSSSISKYRGDRRLYDDARNSVNYAAWKGWCTGKYGRSLDSLLREKPLGRQNGQGEVDALSGENQWSGVVGWVEIPWRECSSSRRARCKVEVLPHTMQPCKEYVARRSFDTRTVR